MAIQFDRDLNGDISMNELEAVCVEIGRERKSITASLKDLDSVVSKLDSILLFFVLVITILVLISLISTSAAGVLTSAGSAVSRFCADLLEHLLMGTRYSLCLGCSLERPRSSYPLASLFLSNILLMLAIESISMEPQALC